MPIELSMLFAATIVTMLLLFVQGGVTPLAHGFKWGLGPRDEPRTPTILQGRMNRIVANHLEGMMMFIPLILIANLAGISTPLTQWGAMIFVGGRIAFAFVYAAGIPVLRSAVWGVSLAGILMLVAALAGNAI